MSRPTRPAQLVDERTRLVQRWQPGQPFWMLATELSLRRRIGGSVIAYVAFEERSLADGALWWVTSEMCDLVEAAMATVPEDTLLEVDLPKDMSALCFFERPLMMTDAATGAHTLVVDAMLWGPARLIDAPWVPDHLTPNAIGISAYQWMPTTGGWTGLVPLGRSDWLIGQRLDEVLRPTDIVGIDAMEYGSSAIEDRRLMAALWLLASQPGIADAEERPVDRATARRATRAGHAARVRVVSLRAQPHAGNGERTGRHMSVRTIVTGHWRNQAYGPGRKYRRPTWIAPFVRGPEDAPLVSHPTVKVLK